MELIWILSLGLLLRADLGPSWMGSKVTAEPEVPAGDNGEADSREPCSRWMGGVPGTPGHDGLPGRDGRDGRVGEKGDLGEPGFQGEKGEAGMSGDEGSVGPRGFPGLPGLKGERGESAFTYRSAFSMGLEGPVDTPDVPIRFPKLFYNEQHDYDDVSGKFRCAIPGLYYFTYHLAVSGGDTKVGLYKNSRPVAFTLDQFQVNDFDQASGAIALRLVAGDEVWLQVYSEEGPAGIYADNTVHSTFTGFLLYPDLQTDPLANRRR